VDRTLITVALLVAGCAPPQDLSLIDALSPDVAWVAALAIDADDVIVASTGVARRAAPSKLFLDIPGEAVAIEVLGFDDAAIAFALTQASEADLRGGLLTAATALDPRLAEPIFAGRHETAGPVIGAATKRLLTAPWLPRCPQIVHATDLADVSCALLSCRPRVTQALCRLEIDATGCGLGVLSGDIDTRGVVRAPVSGVFGDCASVESRAGSGLSIDCTLPAPSGCTVDLRQVTPPATLSVDVLTGTITAAPRVTQDFFPRGGFGYLAGMVALRSQLAVLTNAGGAYFAFQCPPERHSALVYVDPATLQITRTATLPDCTVRVAADPTVEGGLIIGHGGGAHLISQVDPQGNVVKTVTVEGPAADQSLVQLQSRGLPPQIVGAYSNMVRPYASYLFSLTSSLAKRAGEPVPLTQIEVMTIFGDDEVAFTSESVDDLFIFGPDLKQRHTVALWDLCSRGRRIHPMAIVPLSPTTTVFPAASRDAQAAFVLDRGGEAACAPAVSWVLDESEAVAAIAWPRDPKLVLVALGVVGGDAALTLLDVDTPRFLPDRVVVGQGQLTDPVIDERGRIFFLLPNTGQIVRVTPRR